MGGKRQTQSKSRGGDPTRHGQAPVTQRRNTSRGAKPDPAELQRRLGNRGTQMWLAQGKTGQQPVPGDKHQTQMPAANREVAPVVFQRQEIEEEELLQGKFESVQRQKPEEDEEEQVLQGKFATSESPAQFQVKNDEAENRTGMPGPLKTGLETLSGMDLSGVRVHKNSSKPAQLNTLAYTQGQDIHVGPGQERHLPHEGWHAVQQMQGRVKPTIQAKGVSINDDPSLEREADVMGNRIAMGNYNAPILPEQGINPDIYPRQGVSQRKAVIQRWGELQDTPLVSPFFRGDPLFMAVLEDPPQLIRRGQEGPQVRKLQEALLELQYNLPEHGVDGKFGPETETAVRNFQLEAGAPEDAKDGVVGPDTLRELDQRFATAHRSRIVSVAPSGATSQGNNFVFNVPVTRITSEEDFLIVSLRHVFPVSDIEAHVLAGESWSFVRFTELTEADVRRGFRPVSVPISDYESVAGEARRRFSGRTSQEDEDRFHEELDTSLFNLTGTDNIYRLNQEIEEKRDELNAIRGTSIRDTGIDPEYKRRRIADLEAELAALIRRRDAALGRLGITQEIYQQQQQTFKQNFSLLAIRVAQRMLRENEASANVEATRYRNLNRVTEIKQIFSELNNIYQQADAKRNAGNEHEFNELHPNVRHSGWGLQTVEGMFRRHQFPSGRRGGNQHWEASWDFEQRAFDRLQEVARTYPILAHPGLRIRRNAQRYSSMAAPALARVLQDQLTDVNENIAQIRSSLNTQNIWELEAVISRAKYELGILDGTIQATVVADGVREARSRTTIRNLLLAAAGIGLGLLALASGPVGWAALGASIAVGSIDAYLVYQDISFTRAARRTAVDPANALTSLDASWFWFGLSLVCIGIDVAAAVKIARGMGAAARATRSAAELQEEAIRVVDAAVEVTEEAAEGVIQIANRSEVRALLESQRAFDTLRIVGAIEDSAAAARLASAMSENAELLPALLRLEQVSAEAIQFYAGPGHRFLNQLPEVLRVSDAGNLASNPQLYEMLLRDPRLQRVLLDNADNPRLLLDDWATWQRARTRLRDPVSSNFPEYLYLGLGRRTSVARSGKLLTDIFDAGFHSLDNLNKNRQVLRQTAGDLVDAFNSGSLPQRVQDALSEVMNRDLIGRATDLETARVRVVRAVNDAIGANVDDMASYRQVMNLLEQGGSRGALGEAFARIMDLIPGFRSGRRMSMEFGDVGIDVLNGRRVTIDRYVAEGSIIGEIKVGSSFDHAQMLRYKAMYENPDALAGYFRAARVQGDAFDEIIYMVMPGPSSLSRTTREYALTIYRALVREEMNVYSTVHYLDGEGVLWRIVSDNSIEQVRNIN